MADTYTTPASMARAVRRRTSTSLLRVAVIAIVVGAGVTAGCSGDDSPTAGTSRANATDVPADSTVETSDAVAETVPAPSPVDPDVATRVITELNEPALATWVDGALAASKVDDAQACATAYVPLDPSTFELAAYLGDPVVSEMLLDLDAALGAAAEWCRRGDTAAAAAEQADARGTAAAIEARLVEIGVR